MEKKNSQLAKYFTKSSLKTFLLLNLGALMNAVGSYYFRFPNKFSIGGVAGLSVVITKFFPDISSATFLFIMNMVLVVVGFIFLGRNFGAKTAYVSVAISVFTGIFEALTPMPEPFTNQPFLELVFGVAIPSIGTSILFNIDASSGGTDIIAMIFAKYTTLNISKGIFISDIFITLGAFLFGVETGLFSLLGLVLKTLVIDNAIENINLHKYLTIITSKPDEVKAFITQNIHKGATICHGEGAYTGEEKTLILTVTTPAQAVLLRRYIRKIDPESFIFITNTSEIIGKGFRYTN
ncbi:MAG: YitT family protein [Clostridia bacterium]|nr:YitT family protein [Clostridia bacterium]